LVSAQTDAFLFLLDWTMDWTMDWTKTKTRILDLVLNWATSHWNV